MQSNHPKQTSVRAESGVESISQATAGLALVLVPKQRKKKNEYINKWSTASCRKRKSPPMTRCGSSWTAGGSRWWSKTWTRASSACWHRTTPSSWSPPLSSSSPSATATWHRSEASLTPRPTEWERQWVTYLESVLCLAAWPGSGPGFTQRLGSTPGRLG